jgi:tRNA(fMet)-specific endonuclease VapC
MAGYRYLVDANTLSDFIRNPNGSVTKRLAVVGVATVCTSIIVACELRYGVAKKGSPRLAERVDQVLEGLEVLPLDGEADRHYAEIRAHLSRKGQPIGSNDLLIAAHALALDLTLVTANVDEFSRVPGLFIENWVVSRSP